MKGYEDAYRIKLPRRTNVMIRVDGKAFHSYTRDCRKPFDDVLMALMNKTAISLCHEIQGAKLAYVQSDEISIWVTDYDKIETNAWFDNNLQKMASVTASIATSEFNACKMALDKIEGANFDSRVWIIPELAEVANYFLWRSQDCARNSLQMFARSFFSHKELEGKNTSEIHEMLHNIGENWANLNMEYKNGRIIQKNKDGVWTVDYLEKPSFESWMELINRNKPNENI